MLDRLWVMLGGIMRMEALKLLAALIRTRTIKKQEDLNHVISELTQCLHDGQDYVREVAFDVLSQVVIDYPEQKYTFNAQDEACIEEIALIKIREMHALIQAPKDKEYMAHSTLKTIIDVTRAEVGQTETWYARASIFLGFFTPHQSRIREMLNEPLSKKKLCYEKNEIKTAMITVQSPPRFFSFINRQDSEDDDKKIRALIKQGF